MAANSALRGEIVNKARLGTLFGRTRREIDTGLTKFARTGAARGSW
jgi:hypothetical protein